MTTAAIVTTGSAAAFAGTPVKSDSNVQPGEVRLPGKVAPGQKVTVWLGCASPVKVASDALVIGRTRFASDGEDELRQITSATVNKNAKPGTYTVTMDCGGTEKASAKFTVVAAAGKPQVTVRPQGAPQTGGGATAAPFSG